MQIGHKLKSLGRRLHQQTHHTVAAPDVGFVLKNALDQIVPGARDAARRRALLRDGEAARSGSCLLRHHQRGDGVRALTRRDVPGKGEQVAPMAVRHKQRCDGRRAGAVQGHIQLVEPLFYKRFF